MAKVVGILLMLVAVWVAAEVLTKGTDGAFGGAVAALSGESPSPPEERSWAGERARDAVHRAQGAADERRDRALGE